MFLVSVVSHQVEVSVTDRKLVRGIPTKCGVSECDHEPLRRRRPRPTRGCRTMEERRSVVISEDKYGLLMKIITVTKYIPDIRGKTTNSIY